MRGKFRHSVGGDEIRFSKRLVERQRIRTSHKRSHRRVMKDEPPGFGVPEASLGLLRSYRVISNYGISTP